MLAERVKEWTKEWWEGGMAEGQKKGEVLILMRQLERQFGPLSEEQRNRLEAADVDTLLDWSERVLTANAIEEVLQNRK